MGEVRGSQQRSAEGFAEVAHRLKAHLRTAVRFIDEEAAQAKVGALVPGADLIAGGLRLRLKERID